MAEENNKDQEQETIDGQNGRESTGEGEDQQQETGSSSESNKDGENKKEDKGKPEEPKTENAGNDGRGTTGQGSESGDESSLSDVEKDNTQIYNNLAEKASLDIPKYLYPNNFFYDEELSNRLITVTLHPSSIYAANGEGEAWVKPKDEMLDSDGYLKEPLITAVSTDDFNVSVANDWSDANFGSEIQSMINGGAPMAPYAAYFSKLAKWGAQRGEEQIAKELKEGSYTYGTYQIATKINGVLGDMSGWLGDASKNMKRILVLQGTRFSYYAGTGVSFGNLILKYTVFANWMVDVDGKLRFVPVEDQLRRLYDYSIGKYLGWSDIKDGTLKEDKENSMFTSSDVYQPEKKRMENAERRRGMKLIDDSFKAPEDDSWVESLNNVSKNFLETFAGWQVAPGGYEPQIKDVDTISFGTFKLKIGTIYQLTNLVIQDMQLNFSKTMVKTPTVNPDNFEYHPLYCDVQITLKPASKYSDVSLRKFVNRNSYSKEGGGGSDKEDYVKLREKLRQELKNH